jgi:hypothetical protein
LWPKLKGKKRGMLREIRSDLPIFGESLKMAPGRSLPLRSFTTRIAEGILYF